MTYEYKTLTVAPQYAEDMLNQFGAEGWKLAFVAVQSAGLVYIVFERARDEPAKARKRA